MGCFSYICKECWKPILSNSQRGQKVKLFLLKEGKVIEEMEGEYDSYGSVFTDDLKCSIEWSIDTFGLSFSNDESNGIAAIHSKCFKGDIPIRRSIPDPDQGWGEKWEYFGEGDIYELVKDN